MKTINRFFIVMAIMLLLCNTKASAQEQSRPAYVTVTTMHWNMNNKDFKMDEWKAVEKEFLDKVTMKNEHIMSASFYLHNMTPDNTELLYVQSYKNWDAIGKAADRNAELAMAAWPDEKARTAFFKKRSAYYSDQHSDEIYATMPNAKPMAKMPDKDMVCYVRKGHFAFEEGTDEEFEALDKEYFDNVTFKNEYIKAYYPMAHAWGSDRTEFVEAIFVDSLADLEKMLKKDTELFEAHWKDEASRKDMGEKSSKYFTNTHGDYVYTYVAGLAK
ncbi:hypothetical protein M0G43_00845 [Subsaxibacter sp. CAU 1640]|uniref:hypothetical protein n=1 Tax=Subsaxibacter sp. CAU 1640 TaxID=2933271 RepID=UPI002004BE87|nr:hypothetical protein [Subsaxibacter sp. CAU 1640]MCK7589111.1 hypothetical protein [Subsaxibacter sp. CAU 1640]